MKKYTVFFILLSILGCCSFLFYLSYRDVKTKTIAAFNNEQRIMARQAAREIQSFFTEYAISLRYLTRQKDIIDLDQAGRKRIKEFYNQHADKIRAITRIDASGKIVYTVPFVRRAIGRDVSHQAHNRRIMEKHQPLVSEVFRAVQGYRAVAFAMPVFGDHAYRGSLTILIPFQQIAKKYLADIRLGDSGSAWLLSRQGIELFCLAPGHAGQSVFNTFASSPTVLAMARKMIKGEQGTTVYTVKQTRGNTTESVTSHAVYLPIKLPGNFWSIVVATPEDQVLAAMTFFRDAWLVLILVTFTGSILLTAYLFKAWGIVREEERRRAAEKVLRESEKKYRMLVENANDLIFIVQDEVVKYANPKAEEVFGCSLAELKSKPFIEYIHPDDRHMVPAVHRRTPQGGKNENLYSFRAVNEKAEDVYLQINSRLTTWKGRSATIILARDITELKRAAREKEKLEGQLRQALKMEAIGTLAGGIAHDFNNILAAIMGYADLAKDELPADSRAVKRIDAVLKASSRARDLVKQILAFSRKEEQDRAPLQLHLLVKETLKLLRASIPSTIEIRRDIDPNSGHILAEPTQIHQVLMNLCTNAAQAMDEKGGVLFVGLDCLELKEKDLKDQEDPRPGLYVRLTVKDTGCGIDPAIMDRIFDPYFTTKEIGKGSGMGLSVVHGIVKSHDGKITVVSKPDQGTTFKVYFPRVEEEIQPEPAGPAPLPTGAERILFVDDEQDLTDATREILTYLGYRVTATTSSLEALALFRSQPDAFDLVITDQTMPEMTGVQLAGELLGVRPDLPIILCTGYSSKVDAGVAGDMGIRAFAMKPVGQEKLAARRCWMKIPAPHPRDVSAIPGRPPGQPETRRRFTKSVSIPSSA
ncbi:MAG: response regulator [Deltaproteobacteria bacterium]|nr:response regulator [Deltaproteobacteria bacterium]